MTSVVVRWKRVFFRRSAMLGAMVFLVACGGEQPASSGSGGVSAGAGMSGGGAGGTSVVAGSGGVAPATGGAGGAGTGGGGAGVNGGAGMTGSGGIDAGSAGMSSAGAGMAGSPTGGGGAGGASATGGSGGAQALSFRADIFPVFQMTRDPEFVYPGAGSFESCVTGGVCHGGEVAPGGGLAMMDATMAYGELLGVMSESELCNGTIRVAAGNPEQSCLIRFYEGRLRDELDWVDDDEIDLMRRWIAEGALP
jgi:hypothetical protein